MARILEAGKFDAIFLADVLVVSDVIPELQRRGLFKKKYHSGTLHEKLSGKGARLSPTHAANAYRTWAKVPA